MNGESKRPFAPPDLPARYARHRTYDTRHLRLELRLDPRRPDLRGVATLTLVPLESLSSLDLDLASTLHVDSVRSDGGAVRFEHAGDCLRLHWPRRRPGGVELRLAIAYHGVPRRGLYFIGPDAAHPRKPAQVWSQGQDEDSHHWFPCFDHPHDKTTSELLATVPQSFQVIANGKLLGVRRRGRWHTYHWREDAPHPPYLISLVAGDFDTVQQEVDGVPLTYAVPRGERPQVERTFGRTPEMLRFFARSFDFPYPFEKYAQVVVQDFIFGGMENISATTLTDAVLLDAVAATETHSDALIAHELAHQWWGNVLTCKDWAHAWLHEGFATYAEALFLEHHRGRDEFLWKLHGDAEDYFKEDEAYQRPIVERRYTRPVEIFDRHLYEKGGLVLHMLRHELGDALFWKALRHYLRKHAFQNVETADLKIAIEESTGRHLDAFFEQWVLGAGFPRLEGRWRWDETSRQVELQLRQTQGPEGGRACFLFSLDVEVGFARGPRRQRLQVERAQQSFALPAPQRPRYLRLDPEHALLLQLQVEPGREELLAQLESARDLHGQVDAARGLARFPGDAEVTRALGQALRRARFPGTAGEIARALARVGGAAARTALLAALRSDEPRRRRAIVRALAELRPELPVHEALLALWRREPAYLVRAEILRTLARRRADATFALCRRALRLPSYRDCIRAAALEALGLLEDERSIDVVLPWCRYGHSRWARSAAMRALATLGQSFPARARAIEEILIGSLGDRDFFANIDAAEALARLGRPQAVPALRLLARSDVDRRIQRAAEMALRELSDSGRSPEAWKALRAELRDLRQENDDLRRRVERLEAQQRAQGRSRRR